MSKRILFAAAILLAFSLACGRLTPTPRPTARLSPTPTASASPAPAAGFTLAIEYAVPGLAKTYVATGVTYAKPMPAYGVWGNIEPKPGEYHWEPLDAIIVEYQAAGFTGLQLLLSAESPWASVRPAQGLDKGDTFPKEEYLDDYAAFVRQVVERYDGDGTGDAPGLLYPIHHYGIEREFTGFWPGSAAEYVRLLRLAYPQVHAADPQAQVLLVALLATDVFNGVPDPEEIARRWQQPQKISKSLADVRTILAACDAYDLVDFHSLGDYTEIPPTVAWLNQEMAPLGCTKPLWIGDAFGLSGLVGYADPLGIVPPMTFAPAGDSTRDAVLALLQAVADPSAADHDEATTWLRGEMARSLVKKIVVAAGEGIIGINIGNLEDWDVPNAPKVNAGLVRSMGASVYMGMMDTTTTGRYAGGPLQGGYAPTSRIRQAGAARPAFYALQSVAEAIGGYRTVEKIQLQDGVWAYRFDKDSGPVWVLWYDDGKLHLPGDPPPAVEIELAIGVARARVVRIPTAAGETQGAETVVATVDGRLHLAVDATPVWVTAAR